MFKKFKKPMVMLGCVAAIALGNSAYAQEDLKVYYKQGLNFKSDDGAFAFKIGGRVHHDWVFATADDDLKTATGNSFSDGTEMRRARLYMSGTYYKHFKFKAQYDFAGGDADFKDVYLDITKLPLFDSVRVGQFIMAHGFEINTSSNYLTLMERSPAQAFMPDRHAGLMLSKKLLDKKLLFNAFVYRDSDAYGEDVDGGHDGEYNFGFRLSGQPIEMEEGILHLGASYLVRSPAGDSVRFRARPSAHISPRLVDTGGIAADAVNQVAFDVNFTYNSLMLSGEYHQAFVDDTAGEDPNFNAFYIMASYMLTGEQRAWKGSNFTRVKPKTNYGGGDDDSGLGAFELAVRYSRIDLDSESIAGGELTDLALGLNWYMTPNTRIMLNYVFADVSDVGEASYLTARFHFDF